MKERVVRLSTLLSQKNSGKFLGRKNVDRRQNRQLAVDAKTEK
jgi:hypothetical protein